MTAYRAFFAMLLFAAFVTGFASCCLVCAPEDADAQSNAKTDCHCIAHCGCHASALPSAGTELAFADGPRSTLIAGPFGAVLPLFTASIFNPPRA